MTPAELMREDAAKVADKWATDLQSRHGNGGPAAEIRSLPLPAETAESTDTARMKAALGMAKEALYAAKSTAFGMVVTNRGTISVSRAVSDAIATIREALGET